MYRVIIADDEPWVIYSLVHSIDWSVHGFTICATAENGLQALEKCRSLQPDVLFSDIRMPGLDGLELLENLRRELPNIEMVFISGYAEFNYAQQAVRHGAFDYLIKQVSNKQLIETLERLKGQLAQKKRLTLNDAYFALLDEDNMLSIADWMKYHSQYRDYPHFRFVTFSVKEQDQEFSMKEYWLPEFGQLMLRTGRNKYSAFIGYTSYNRFDDWLTILTKKYTEFIGISNEEKSNHPFTSLHKQGDIAFYSAMITSEHSPLIYSKEYPQECEQAITEYIKLVEANLKSADINMCVHLLSQISIVSKGLMLDRVADLYNLLISLLKRYLSFDVDALEPYGYRRIASEFTSIDAVFYFLKQNIQTYDTLNSSDFMIHNILQYIDGHFTDEIYVSELASRYHFSPCYFSTLFKKQTGTTLTRYITAKRITLAKQLLNESDLSIQDIVERIGYNDYFQFIKVFKKEVGITPGHYRNK